MIRDAKLRIIDKEYGRENLKFTIYWCGPHPSGGSPHGMRLDITRNEVVLFEPARREVAHDFSDSEELGTVELDCYTLEEVIDGGPGPVCGERPAGTSTS